MPARAISSATISFGLVSIPVKVFTAASSQQARFNMLHPKSRQRLKQQLVSPADGNEVVDRRDTVRGYEYAKDQYVVFTEEEIKALEAERTNAIEIVEFVPLESVDFVFVEKSYYLGPDKGGDKAYKLLNQAMGQKNKVAVGRWTTRGKEQLILLRPYKDGLILHQLYHANEVRAFDDVDTGATFQFSEVEQDLAQKLIDQLSTDTFAPDGYRDEYAERVKAAVEEKVAGKEITIAPEEPKAQIIDLFEALKKSLAEGPQAKAGPKKIADADAEAAGDSAPKGVKKVAAKSSKKRKTG